MRIRTLALAAMAIVASSSLALADSCLNTGALGSGPPTSGGSGTTVNVFNNTGVGATVYSSDQNGNLTAMAGIEAAGGNAVTSFSASGNNVFYVEGNLDGFSMCGGAFMVQASGECNVSLEQNDGNFFLQASGACQLR